MSIDLKDMVDDCKNDNEIVTELGIDVENVFNLT